VIVCVYGKMICSEECVIAMGKVLSQKAVMCFSNVDAIVAKIASVAVVLVNLGQTVFVWAQDRHRERSKNAGRGGGYGK
jgi:hypothetical protein